VGLGAGYEFLLRLDRAAHGLTAVCWRIPLDGEFQLRRFGEEAVLFDGRDGRTHYLSPVGTLILGALGAAWRTTDVIIRDMEVRLGIQFDATERERVEVAIQQLASLGIVNRKCASTN